MLCQVNLIRQRSNKNHRNNKQFKFNKFITRIWSKPSLSKSNQTRLKRNHWAIFLSLCVCVCVKQKQSLWSMGEKICSKVRNPNRNFDWNQWFGVLKLIWVNLQCGYWLYEDQGRQLIKLPPTESKIQRESECPN